MIPQFLYGKGTLVECSLRVDGDHWFADVDGELTRLDKRRVRSMEHISYCIQGGMVYVFGQAKRRAANTAKPPRARKLSAAAITAIRKAYSEVDVSKTKTGTNTMLARRYNVASSSITAIVQLKAYPSVETPFDGIVGGELRYRRDDD